MANRLKMALIDAILSLKARRWSNRRIARELGVDRDTVARHLQRGARANAAKAPIGATVLPAESNAAKAPIGAAAPVTEATADPGGLTRSACEPWRAVIVAKLEQRLTAQRIY